MYLERDEDGVAHRLVYVGPSFDRRWKRACGSTLTLDTFTARHAATVLTCLRCIGRALPENFDGPYPYDVGS